MNMKMSWRWAEDEHFMAVDVSWVPSLLWFSKKMYARYLHHREKSRLDGEVEDDYETTFWFWHVYFHFHLQRITSSRATTNIIPAAVESMSSRFVHCPGFVCLCFVWHVWFLNLNWKGRPWMSMYLKITVFISMGCSRFQTKNAEDGVIWQWGNVDVYAHLSKTLHLQREHSCQ